MTFLIKRRFTLNQIVKLKLVIFGFVYFFSSMSYSSTCQINVAIPSLMSTKDPLKAISWWAKRESTLQFDTLFRFTDSGEIQPWLARKWQFSKDLTVLTIELRPGVKFTDGSVIDSLAVVKSLNRFIAKGSADHGRLSNIKSINKVDQLKFEIKLDKPFSPLLYYLATPRSGIVKEDKNEILIGSGPWIFEKSDLLNSRKAQIWKSNINYFNGAPLCEKLALIEIPMDQLSTSFKNKQISQLVIKIKMY